MPNSRLGSHACRARRPRTEKTSDAIAGKREIAKAFGLKGQEKIALKALLKDMAEEGLIDGRKTVLHLIPSGVLRDGVIEAPHGAHFTECPPDYGRDEEFQKEYAATARDPESWALFQKRYLSVDGEAAYQEAVRER